MNYILYPPLSAASLAALASIPPSLAKAKEV